jgi:hypothetical protein
MIQDTQLGEHRGLIPIEVLVSYFPGVKLDDAHEGELDPSTSGSNTGKHPIHVEGMRKADHEFFDDPIGAEGLRQRGQIESGGMFGRN